MKQYVEAGKIVNTHGVTGEVKIEVWLDSPAFFKTFKRLFINGAEKKILSAREHKQFIIARLEGVEDLNAAMALKGKTVEILRADARMTSRTSWASRSSTRTATRSASLSTRSRRRPPCSMLCAARASI